MTKDTTVVRVTTSQDPSIMPLAEPDWSLRGEAAHSGHVRVQGVRE